MMGGDGDKPDDMDVKKMLASTMREIDERRKITLVT